MKTLVITSRITFVPHNYDHLIVGLAACEQVGGLLILDNLDHTALKKTVEFFTSGAIRIGWTIIRNMLGSSHSRRVSTYAAKGKPVWVKKNINDPEVLHIIESHRFDLVLNARTRYIYNKHILQKPRLGALNIHHGLLPEQRGTMCDLWALFQDEPAGFSIHKMTEKIDGGDLIEIHQMTTMNRRNYLEYLECTSKEELAVLVKLLERIEKADSVNGSPNIKTKTKPFRKDPTQSEFKSIKKKGILV